jgi:hypothetical protein
VSEVSRYVPGPYNGVSQVAPQTRLEGTCEAMEDCVAVIPTGLQKRPPMEYHSKVFTSALAADALMQEIPTGEASTAVALILNKASGVVTPHLRSLVDGSTVACSVSADAQAYLNLNGPSPATDLYVTTVEDTTFISNRTVLTDTNADAEADRPFEAILWVKIGAFARQYAFTITPDGGTPVSGGYRPDDGTHGEDALGVGTDRIATALYDGTVISGSGGTHNGSPLTDLTSQGFTVILRGSAIYLSHPTTDFVIVATDDQGGNALSAIKGSVQRFSDLPSVRRLPVPLGGPSPDVTVTISNNSHLGFTLLGYEWVGDWTQRGIRRVS